MTANSRLHCTLLVFEAMSKEEQQSGRKENGALATLTEDESVSERVSGRSYGAQAMIKSRRMVQSNLQKGT